MCVEGTWEAWGPGLPKAVWIRVRVVFRVRVRVSVLGAALRVRVWVRAMPASVLGAGLRVRVRVRG